MDLKRKLLYATLFASSCLLSTNIVKADTVNNNLDTTVSQSVAKTDTAVTTERAKTSDVSVSTVTNETDNTTSDKQVQTQAQDTQQTNATSSAPTQVQTQVQSKPVDGVYTVGNQITYLHHADGTQITNRALGPNSVWYTDTLKTMSDGTNYYRVATDEFADGNNGTFTSYVQPYQGNATIVYQKG